MEPQNQIDASKQGEAPPAVPDKGSEPWAYTFHQGIRWSEWALVIALTILIGLSGAQLLGTIFFELMIDYKSALLRIVVLLPVMVISSYMVLRLWRELVKKPVRGPDE